MGIKVEFDLDIQAGDVWKNLAGYKLKVLDVGLRWIWAEWENGNKDIFEYNKLLEAGYTIYSR